MPENNSYIRLMKAVINRLSVSREKRLHRTPSQFVCHTRFFANDYELDDEILRELWMKASIFTTSTHQDDLDKLAEMTDRI
nr:hypothetical transcript [Hymenolepis microstoma]